MKKSAFALSTVLCIGLAGTASAAHVYSQNFNGFANGTTDLGDGSVMNGTAQIVNNQLQLTQDGVAGGFASFNIPKLPGSNKNFTASFNVTIFDSPGANPPADGFSFNYGNFALTELGGAEEGMGAIAGVTENLSFEVDTWQNFDAEQGVNIAEKVGGVDNNLAFTNGPILNDGTSVTGSVLIAWDPDNGASFITQGLETDAFFLGMPTSFDAQPTHNFGISARVGGANQTVLIDNLVVSTPEPSSIALLGLGGLGFLLRRRRQ